MTMITREQWLDKVRSELKGKDPEELKWLAGDEILVDPFGHIDDVDNKVQSSGNSESAQWGNGFDFGKVTESNIEQTNELLLELLERDLEACYFKWTFSPTETQWDSLYREVYKDMIFHFHDFSELSAPLKGATDYLNYLGSKKMTSLKGVIHLGKKNVSDDNLSSFLMEKRLQFPNIHCFNFTVNEGLSSNISITDDISELLLQVDQIVNNSGDLKPDMVIPEICVTIYASENFYTNLTVIRAVRHLLANYFSAIGINSTHEIPIFSFLRKDLLQEDPNTNLISFPLVNMACGIGGANYIFLPDPSDGKKGSQYSKLAIQSQQILKLESHIDHVTDPVSGSYFFDKFMIELVNNTWERFKEKLK